MKQKYVLGLLILSGLLSACASSPDNTYSQSASAQTGKDIHWNAQSEHAKASATLTDLVSLPGLDGFIQEALSNNTSVQQTLITLRRAQVAIESAKAEGNLNASASFQGVRTSDSASQNSSNTNTYTAGLDISWELDVWQKISDGVDAASFNAASSRATLQATQDTLVANLIRSYLDIITQKQLLAVEHRRLEVFENSESVILKRYRTGLGALDDLDDARTNSASTKATIAEYEYTLATNLRAFALLLGRQDLTLADFPTIDAFPQVSAPLASLPAQDLARRPDLQSAYYALKSTESSVNVAYKALLPSINLSAALSDSATTPSQALFTNPVWTLLGQMTAPLFQGGALRAQIKDAELASLNAWWQYRETLLQAVKETQDALDNERSLTLQRRYTEQALDNATRSADTAKGQYRQGLIDILDLLSVYNTRFNLQAQQLQLHASQLQNRIDLGLALGLGVSQ
ncbi:efflux transporter outer membrane subunit [Alteromonas sp. 345S023]|uniref:Efflux transporter outer membrane subunit n=1 Tax=Alteromonas profundi TaxID=2696062 RepID=A0A7X5RLA0_9ALTE|nr:TolC family protein [Alteromonas profundi]NDV91469.1 efflux transporter outer membrane subunit [Alteromonas profundi]